MLAPARHSTRRRRRLLVAGTAVSALLAACSSSVGSTTSTAPQAVPSATTAPPVVTDAPSTTQAPNAATPLVRQAVLDYWAASRACGQRPKSCRPASFTASEGTLRADVQTYVAMLISSNAHLGTLETGGSSIPADAGYVVVNTVNVDLSTNTAATATATATTATTATTDECVYDPTPLLGPPGARGAATVISSDAVPRRFVHTFYLEDGRWLPGAEDVDTSSACNSTPDTVAVDYTTPGS